MNTLDNLNRELEDFGFQINGDEYLYEKVTYQDKYQETYIFLSI